MFARSTFPQTSAVVTGVFGSFGGAPDMMARTGMSTFTWGCSEICEVNAGQHCFTAAVRFVTTPQSMPETDAHTSMCAFGA